MGNQEAVLNSTASTNSSQDPCVDDTVLQMPLVVLYSVVFLLGLAGNLLALWVFFFVQRKKNSMRVFLVNLALSDVLLALCLPFRIQYHLVGNRWKLPPWLCKLVGHLLYMNMYISITLLGVISVDRYLKIYGSVRIRRKMRSPTWSVVACVIIWTLSLALMVPFVTGKSQHPERCFHYKKIETQEIWKAKINIFVLVAFWLVFIALTVSYGRIGQKLRWRSKERPDLPTAPHYSRVARKSFFILFLFSVCFVPYHVSRGFYIKTQITEVDCYWRNLADKFNEISLVVSTLNSVLDPVMFFLLSATVRREVGRFVSSVLRVRGAGGATGTTSSTDLDNKTDSRLSNVHFVGNLNDKEAASSSCE